MATLFSFSVFREGVNETDQGHLARIFSARAVGIAGGPEKCDYVRGELGFDVAIDHRSPSFATELAAACPNGIDIYFENVGGHVWSAVFPLLNDCARIPVCGLIAHYNEDRSAADTQDQLPAVMRAILRKSLNIRGFIQREFADQRPDFYREAAAWISDGRPKYRKDIVEGLEKAPDAFIGVLDGGGGADTLIGGRGNDFPQRQFRKRHRRL